MDHDARFFCVFPKIVEYTVTRDAHVLGQGFGHFLDIWRTYWKTLLVWNEAYLLCYNQIWLQ